ncbi:8-amino-3,8-dideoxy-manno-octulosonate cytidylyltransferase [Pontiella desulfatans]|uniref:3-deoxy-manno-octulosonate cytidylyltransferase n=1 Tax=Pontiella desulfatans TaxID=2750659 RepID=A0A6C2TWT5_PONDE|nr:3-deoxy-manno-octulosonate cytidylyltransferase [Pontiella desulfatans]VGO12063.1 8-amino-3,8-dideoxy-manno-octulosonate cytidylyltransferase [Pontiella desulfatans]
MQPTLTKVHPISNHRLLLTYDNGEEREFDVAPYLDTGIFKELKDDTLFNSARVSFDTIEWNNGADLCPEVLYDESVPAGNHGRMVAESSPTYIAKDRKMKIVGVIPSRWGSTRFPGKSLAMISGKPMVQWVVERVKQAQKLDAVIVATDDERIADCVNGLNMDGVTVAMTRPDHPSGTDRIAEAVQDMDIDAVINVQGDEPLIDPALIDDLADVISSGEWDMATAATPIDNEDQIEDPSVVKAVFNRHGQALYFSRSSIPHIRDVTGEPEPGIYWRHIGIYAYRRDYLLKLVAEPPCALENLEKLEQLRALDMGCRMKVIQTQDFGIGVDTPEDVVKAEVLLNNL